MDKADAQKEARKEAAHDLQLESVLAYTFRDKGLLARALTHSSLAYEQASGKAATPAKARRSPLEDNEQLEFLGDAVLGLIVAEALYRAHPEMSEGQLTRLRSALVSRKHMSQVANRMHLGGHLRMGRGEERSGGRKKPALLANAAEALIAAVYLDAAANQRKDCEAGLAAAREIIARHVIEPSLPALINEAARSTSIGDHKSALQEFLQSEHRGQLHYTVTGQSGPDHRKRFLVEVRLPAKSGEAGEALARGIGGTKKHAEQEAARRALRKLQASPRAVRKSEKAIREPQEPA